MNPGLIEARFWKWDYLLELVLNTKHTYHAHESTNICTSLRPSSCVFEQSWWMHTCLCKQSSQTRQNSLLLGLSRSPRRDRGCDTAVGTSWVCRGKWKGAKAQCLCVDVSCVEENEDGCYWRVKEVNTESWTAVESICSSPALTSVPPDSPNLNVFITDEQAVFSFW